MRRELPTADAPAWLLPPLVGLVPALVAALAVALCIKGRRLRSRALVPAW